MVAAARNAHVKDRGIADKVVRMGEGDDTENLKAASNGGYDAVLDMVFGEPGVAALRATRWGARMATVGIGAGPTVTLHAKDLLFRSLMVVGTGQRAPADREAIWHRMIGLAREHRIEVDQRTYDLDRIAEAWEAQQAAPHAKITGRIR